MTDITTRVDHTAKAFDVDLQEITRKVAEMGGLAERQISDASRALVDRDTDLAERVAAGRFEGELYDLLSAAVIELPPLRARSEDIPALAEHFRLQVNAREGRRVPGFALDEVAAHIFGREGVEYELPFPTSDAGQIAIEVHDFARAVLNDSAPEIDGHGGLTALAAVLGVFESNKIGRPVTMDEMLTSAVSGWQDELDRAKEWAAG